MYFYFRLYVSVLLIGTFVVACSNEERKLKHDFANYKIAVINNSGTEFLMDFVDNDTKLYFYEIIKIAQNYTEGKVRLFTKSSEHPLTDKLLIWSVRNALKTRKIEPKDVYELAKHVKLPIVNPKEVSNFVTLSPGLMANNETVVDVRVKGYAFDTLTGKSASLLTTIKFSKEDGIWKINLPSAFELNEKIYELSAKKANLTPDEYIKLLVFHEERPASDEKLDKLQ